VSDKANPLDRLTRPGGRPISDDESIPILTERLTLPSLDLDISLPQPPPAVGVAPLAVFPAVTAAAPAPASATAIPLPPRSAPPAPPSPGPVRAPAPPPVPSYSSAPSPTPIEVDWAGIEQSLRDAVFRELQPALADQALHLLRERLHPAVERALQVTASELRQAFESRLREAVGRAVRAELAKQRERN
jgi:hypothetical protein